LRAGALRAVERFRPVLFLAANCSTSIPHFDPILNCDRVTSSPTTPL
jgi:hypothetical protein